MTRQEIYNQIRQAFGSVPGWMEEMTDTALNEQWTNLTWFLSDSGISARDKALVAYGAAAAIHCQY